MSLEDIEANLSELWGYFDYDHFGQVGLLWHVQVYRSPDRQVQQINDIISRYQEGIGKILSSCGVEDVSDKILLAVVLAKEALSKKYIATFRSNYKTFTEESQQLIEALPNVDAVPWGAIKSIDIRLQDGKKISIKNKEVLALLDWAIRDVSGELQAFPDQAERADTARRLNRRNSPELKTFLRNELIKGLLLFLNCNTSLPKKLQCSFVGDFLKAIDEPLLKRGGETVLPENYGDYITKSVLRRRQ
jgi:hypothetical protein